MFESDSNEQRQDFSRDPTFGGQQIHRPQLNYSYDTAPDYSSDPSTSAGWNFVAGLPPVYSPATRSFIAVSMVIVDVGMVPHPYGYKPIPMVARVTLTDQHNTVILDTYVQPTHRITSYRTEITGLNYTHLQNAPTFEIVQRMTAKIILNNVIVGHRLWDFLSVMGLSHPAIDTRDLALFRPLRKRLKSRCVIDVKILVRFFVGREIGMGYEDSLETAAACMDLFRVCHQLFESVIHSGSWPCDLPPNSFSRHYL